MSEKGDKPFSSSQRDDFRFYGEKKTFLDERVSLWFQESEDL